MPVEDMLWGERYGIIRDPFGHRWAVTTGRQDLTPDEIGMRTPPHVYANIKAPTVPRAAVGLEPHQPRNGRWSMSIPEPIGPLPNGGLLVV